MLGAMTGIGWLIGIPAGGIIATHFGNQAPMIATITVSALNVLIILVFLREPDRKLQRKESDAGIIKNIMGMFQLLQNKHVRELLIARMMQETAMALISNCTSEVQRVVYNLSAQLRGFTGMYNGILSTIVQARIGILTQIIGGPEKTIALSFTVLVGVALLFPFAHDLATYLVLATFWQLSAAFLLPLLNSLMSRSTPPAKQGALLGASDSMVSLGAVVGPLATGYLFDISQQLPFIIGAVAFGAGLYAFSTRSLGSESPNIRVS